MKNINIFLSICVLVIVMSQSACVEDVPVSEITNVPFDVETIATPNIVTSEANTTYTVDFALDEGQIVAATVDITLDEANTTATNGVDFNFTPTSVEIPAYVRNGSFTFDILEDLVAEGDEVIKFKIGPHNAPFSISSSHDVNVTIQDSIYPSLGLSFDWGGTISYDTSGVISEHSLCAEVDLDFFLADSNGDFVLAAASADCPESFIIDGLADGQYTVVADMWGDFVSPSDGSVFNYPVTTTAIKGGVFNTTYLQKEEFQFNSGILDSGYEGGATLLPVVIINISGTTYTITDPDGMLIVEGLIRPVVR